MVLFSCLFFLAEEDLMTDSYLIKNRLLLITFLYPIIARVQET